MHMQKLAWVQCVNIQKITEWFQQHRNLIDVYGKCINLEPKSNCTLRIHAWCILNIYSYTYICLMFMVNVGKGSYEIWLRCLRITKPASQNNLHSAHRTWGGTLLSKFLWKPMAKIKGSVKTNNIYIGVSENSGTPKSSILIGFSIINHPFLGTSIFWKHPYTPWKFMES